MSFSDIDCLCVNDDFTHLMEQQIYGNVCFLSFKIIIKKRTFQMSSNGE